MSPRFEHLRHGMREHLQHAHGFPPWAHPRRRRLHHLLFIWLALTIVATAAVVWLCFWLTHPGELPSVQRARQVSALVSSEFAEHWADPPRRQAFARALGDAFGATLWLEAPDGTLLERVGPECHTVHHTIDVHQGEALIGRVKGCFNASQRHSPLTALVMLLGACSVLWGAAALVAHKISRPLSMVIGVTREIGSGNLSARVRLGRYQKGEVGLLAESVNDMASRIERQMKDQRELLAAVSHEVRSPLARLLVCAELLRTNSGNTQALGALEREVSELDALVGKLLVNSRLDFDALTKKHIVAAELAREVLARRQLPAELLEDKTDGASVGADATLVARALENLLDNAANYGKGATCCRLRSATAAEAGIAPQAIVFEVCDAGPGIEPRTLPRVFDAFYRANNDSHEAGSLGLGLALVRRIAQAHGGKAWADNLPGGGACVAFSVGAAGVAAAASAGASASGAPSSARGAHLVEQGK